jgi:hypothetical protein
VRGSDPLFNKYKDLAQDQSWLKEIGGPSHKKWYPVTETKHREPKTKMLCLLFTVPGILVLAMTGS